MDSGLNARPVADTDIVRDLFVRAATFTAKSQIEEAVDALEGAASAARDDAASAWLLLQAATALAERRENRTTHIDTSEKR